MSRAVEKNKEEEGEKECWCTRAVFHERRPYLSKDLKEVRERPWGYLGTEGSANAKALRWNLVFSVQGAVGGQHVGTVREGRKEEQEGGVCGGG